VLGTLQAKNYPFEMSPLKCLLWYHLFKLSSAYKADSYSLSVTYPTEYSHWLIASLCSFLNLTFAFKTVSLKKCSNKNHAKIIFSHSLQFQIPVLSSSSLPREFTASWHQARASLPGLDSNEQRKRHHGNPAIHHLCFLHSTRDFQQRRINTLLPVFKKQANSTPRFNTRR